MATTDRSPAPFWRPTSARSALDRFGAASRGSGPNSRARLPDVGRASQPAAIDVNSRARLPDVGRASQPATIDVGGLGRPPHFYALSCTRARLFSVSADCDGSSNTTGFRTKPVRRSPVPAARRRQPSPPLRRPGCGTATRLARGRRSAWIGNRRSRPRGTARDLRAWHWR
jgi:hypothetical protein